jgi:enoyl-CoA hydratase/carnithine racemase
LTYGYDGVLKVTSDGPIRIITLDDPDTMNSMTEEMHDGIMRVWLDIAQDQDVRAVVITGTGRAFSAGGNIPGFLRTIAETDYRRKELRMAKLVLENILNCHVPVVAAVNGAAVGLGCSVAVAADIVLMSDASYLADTHVSIGLVAGDGGVVTWPFMMSLLKVKEYLFTGERIPAEKAVELGLANRVVPADQLMAEAMTLAKKLAAQPPQAIQDTKRALNVYLQDALNRVMPFALAAESESFTSPELAATAKKFTEKG